MKKLFFFLLLAPALCFGQGTRFLYSVATGSGMVQAPGATVAGSVVGTTQAFAYRDTIPKATLMPGRVYEFDIYESITTGLSLLPTLSQTVYVGSDSVQLTTASALAASQTTGPVHLHITIAAVTASQQIVTAELFQQNGVIVLGQTYVLKRGIFYQTDWATTNKIVSVRTQFGAALNLATTTLFVDLVNRRPY